MRRTSLILCISLSIFAPDRHPSHAAEEGLLKRVTSIAKDAAVDYLAGKQFDVKITDFKGTFQAIEPQKRVSISVRDFRLADDKITAKVIIQARFLMDGKVTVDGKATKINSQIDTTTTVATEAVLVQKNGEFFVRPRVKELSVEFDILKVTPDNVPGGSQALMKVAGRAFKKRKAEIIESVNEQLKAPLKLSKLEF